MTVGLLPPNATPLERSLDLVAGHRIDAVPVPLATLWRPETCPRDLLPWLAWSLSTDAWDDAWPEAVRRRVIAAAVEVHRHKGTVGSVRRVLDAIGIRVDLTEWWQAVPEGPPHTFDLTAWINANLTPGSPILSQRLYDGLRRAVDATKPARSHYTFRVGARFDQRLQAATGALAHQVARRAAVTRHTPSAFASGLAAGAGATITAAARRSLDAGFTPRRLPFGITAASAAGLWTVVRGAVHARPPAAQAVGIVHLAAAATVATVCRCTMEAA